MSIEAGQQAPDFTLADEQGNQVTLSSFRGEKSVTLVFIPFAFTGVCQGELCELRDNLNAFETADNQVLAITCDRAPSLKAWKAEQGFNFPMLSDGWPHGAVAQQYDCFNADLGCAMRRTVVVGKDGVISDVFTSGGLGEARPFSSYTAALEHV
jgi:peroxiredoxin (alkyl hydroperoxide reductase subunit C)